MTAKWIAGWVSVAALLAGCQDAPATPAESPDLRGGQFFAMDSSGLGHHGVNQGSPELGLPGRRGTSYSFSSPSSWIQVASTDELKPRRASFLVSAWVNLAEPPPAGETMDLVRKGLDGPGGKFSLEIEADGRVKCTVTDAGHHDATSYGPAVNVADGSWHRVGCVRTPLHLTVIVDEQMTFKPVVTGMVRPTLALAIGSKYGIEDTAGPDRLDEVAYYIARAPDTWKRESPPFKRRLDFLQRPNQLVGLWHLDESDVG